MSKTKEAKKRHKQEALRQSRKNKEGGKHHSETHIHGLSAAEVEGRENALRSRVHDAEAAMKQIAKATEGSRWKEAKFANEIATEFLTVHTV